MLKLLLCDNIYSLLCSILDLGLDPGPALGQSDRCSDFPLPSAPSHHGASILQGTHLPALAKKERPLLRGRAAQPQSLYVSFHALPCSILGETWQAEELPPWEGLDGGSL